MAATCQIQLVTGATTPPVYPGQYANAETGAKFNREDTLTGTTPVPIPTTTGTNYSWIKNFALVVTGTSTTNISNRRIAEASSAPTGINLFFKNVAVASYAQAAAGTMPAASGSNGATPAGYTLMTTSNQVWDATSVATSSTGPNGALVVTVLGVDNTYTGGAGSAISLPTLNFVYDEQ